MTLVNLASGGLDSSVVSLLAFAEGVVIAPLFVNYGQRAAEREWHACRAVHERLRLPPPHRVDVPGYGAMVGSGLTDPGRDIVADAFTPGRNMLLLLLGAAYAFKLGFTRVGCGLLSADLALFPDQSNAFVAKAEDAIEAALGRRIEIVLPLREFVKTDVVRLASELGVTGTYSCHLGHEEPCGNCIACREYD